MGSKDCKFVEIINTNQLRFKYLQTRIAMFRIEQKLMTQLKYCIETWSECLIRLLKISQAFSKGQWAINRQKVIVKILIHTYFNTFILVILYNSDIFNVEIFYLYRFQIRGEKTQIQQNHLKTAEKSRFKHQLFLHNI